MKNYDFMESYNIAILMLSLFITLSYFLNIHIPKIIHAEGKTPISKPVYIEIAHESEYPYIVELDTEHEANKFLELYRLERLPKNGDKLVISGDDKVIFSRIDGKKSVILGVPIGINSATLDDLTDLPGIGPKLAQKIIEYRRLNGRFKNLYELEKIDGIGDKKFSSIKRLISLD